MYCQFYNGPLDGWEHNCPAARIGEEWRVSVTSPAYCLHASVMNEILEDFEPSYPIASYQLIAEGVMKYQGMLVT